MVCEIKNEISDPCNQKKAKKSLSNCNNPSKVMQKKTKQILKFEKYIHAKKRSKIVFRKLCKKRDRNTNHSVQKG